MFSKRIEYVKSMSILFFSLQERCYLNNLHHQDCSLCTSLLQNCSHGGPRLLRCKRAITLEMQLSMAVDQQYSMATIAFRKWGIAPAPERRGRVHVLASSMWGVSCSIGS
jgi:hypothetical protein